MAWPIVIEKLRIPEGDVLLLEYFMSFMAAMNAAVLGCPVNPVKVNFPDKPSQLLLIDGWVPANDNTSSPLM